MEVAQDQPIQANASAPGTPSKPPQSGYTSSPNASASEPVATSTSAADLVVVTPEPTVDGNQNLGTLTMIEPQSQAQATPQAQESQPALVSDNEDDGEADLDSESSSCHTMPTAARDRASDFKTIDAKTIDDTDSDECAIQDAEEAIRRGTIVGRNLFPRSIEGDDLTRVTEAVPVEERSSSGVQSIDTSTGENTSCSAAAGDDAEGPAAMEADTASMEHGAGVESTTKDIQSNLQASEVGDISTIPVTALDDPDNGMQKQKLITTAVESSESQGKDSHSVIGEAKQKSNVLDASLPQQGSAVTIAIESGSETGAGNEEPGHPAAGSQSGDISEPKSDGEVLYEDAKPGSCNTAMISTSTPGGQPGADSPSTDVFDRLYRNEKRQEPVWKAPPLSPPPRSRSKSPKPVPQIFDRLYHNEKREESLWQEPEPEVINADKSSGSSTAENVPEIFERLYNNEKREEALWQDRQDDISGKTARPSTDADKELPEIFDRLYHNEKRQESVWQEPEYVGDKLDPIPNAKGVAATDAMVQTSKVQAMQDQAMKDKALHQDVSGQQNKNTGGASGLAAMAAAWKHKPSAKSIDDKPAQKKAVGGASGLAAMAALATARKTSIKSDAGAPSTDEQVEEPKAKRSQQQENTPDCDSAASKTISSSDSTVIQAAAMSDEGADPVEKEATAEAKRQAEEATEAKRLEQLEAEKRQDEEAAAAETKRLEQLELELERIEAEKRQAEEEATAEAKRQAEEAAAEAKKREQLELERIEAEKRQAEAAAAAAETKRLEQLELELEQIRAETRQAEEEEEEEAAAEAKRRAQLVQQGIEAEKRQAKEEVAAEAKRQAEEEAAAKAMGLEQLELGQIGAEKRQAEEEEAAAEAKMQAEEAAADAKRREQLVLERIEAEKRKAAEGAAGGKRLGQLEPAQMEVEKRQVEEKAAATETMRLEQLELELGKIKAEKRQAVDEAAAEAKMQAEEAAAEAKKREQLVLERIEADKRKAEEEAAAEAKRQTEEATAEAKRLEQLELEQIEAMDRLAEEEDAAVAKRQAEETTAEAKRLEQLHLGGEEQSGDSIEQERTEEAIAATAAVVVGAVLAKGIELSQQEPSKEELVHTGSISTKGSDPGTEGTENARDTAESVQKANKVSFAPSQDAKDAHENTKAAVPPNPNGYSQYKTPLQKKSSVSGLSSAKTAATEELTVATLTPPGSADSQLKPSKLSSQFQASPFHSNRSDIRGGGFGYRPVAASTAVVRRASTASPGNKSNNDVLVPQNEFQLVHLRKPSTKMVDRYIKETKLEFAELVASALKKNKNDANNSLEALRHIDDLKQEVAILQKEEEDATLWAINKLRSELLDMFNQGGPMQEAYLLRWILPLHRQRDPQTGRLIMSADQVALLQSFSTSEELSKVSGLGMVRSVLQSNFKAINGAQALEDIHAYAHYRFGRKGKRAPQNPWGVLAELFDTAQKDDSTEDIHQRVCNALVQWVVREILGSTRDTVDSKSCFHAIFLVASLKLELQRLAPEALEQGPSVEVLENDSSDSHMITAEKTSPQALPPRPPIVQKLLASKAFTEDLPPEDIPPGDHAVITTPVQPNDNSHALSDRSSIDESDKAMSMREAMMHRDSSRKEIDNSRESFDEPTPESELPEAVRDAHRVIRAILTSHKGQTITVSRCFEAIKLYSELIRKWKVVNDEQLRLTEAEGATIMSSPTFEEEKLQSLGQVMITREPSKPPNHIEIQLERDDGVAKKEEQARHEKERQKRKKRRRRRKKREKRLKAQSEEKGATAEVKPEERQRIPDGRDQDPDEPAQLDIAALMKETPVASPGDVPSPPPSIPTKKALQKSAQAKVQKTAEASQAQARKRNTLFAKLKRIKLTTKPGSSGSAARGPSKRKWGKFLGGSEKKNTAKPTNYEAMQDRE